MKAFIFANDQDPTHEIDGLSYAYLPLEGRPLLLYVLMALDRVSDIEEMTIIGSQKKIMQVIESVMFEMPFQTKISVVEQKKSFFESFKAVNEHLGDGLQMVSEPALFLPGNIPYLTSAEISTFIAASDMTTSDICLSRPSEKGLSFFSQRGNIHPSPASSKPEDALGHLFIARGDSLIQNTTFKALYEHLRESTYDKNALEVFLKNGLIADKQRKEEPRPSLIKIEQGLSENLNLNFKFSETVSAGNTLAVYDKNTYQYVLEHFSAWREWIIVLKSDEGEQICSISGTVCDSESILGE